MVKKQSRSKISRAIFLDRDGVINRAILKKKKPFSPRKIKDFIFLPRVKKTLEKIYKSYLIIIITNQPDISTGNLSIKEFKKMNKKIFNTLSVDDIFFCPHSNLDCCSCRKPKIGMFLKAKKKWGINFKKSYVVGDRWKDISAGLKIGCKTIFIDKKYKERTPYIFDFKIKSLYGILKIL